MILDRKQQRLLLDGIEFTPELIAEIVAQGASSFLSGEWMLKANYCAGKPQEGQSFFSACWDLFLFLNCWFDDSPFLTVHTSGSTGIPKERRVRKEQMIQSARLTCEFLSLQPGDRALLCMNLRYIGAMMVVVRSLVAGLNLVVRPASGHPLSHVHQSLQFAAMVPLQVYNTLRVPKEREQLMQTACLIIGGGAVDEALERELKDLPIAVYSTYGMTETLSHIALRRLTGPSASERYTPFPSVTLSLSPQQTLNIQAPLVCDEVLHTRDIACLYPDGSFTIVGRLDNVINSGGVKIQAEEVEKVLRSFLTTPFAITSVPDPRLGESVTLLVEGEVDAAYLNLIFQKALPPYHRPRFIFTIDRIPHTENGKISRAVCREWAQKSLQKLKTNLLY